MAVPKKKVSPGRKKIRRQFYALTAESSVTCPNCMELKRQHRVCACGYYNGKKVRETTENTVQE